MPVSVQNKIILPPTPFGDIFDQLTKLLDAIKKGSSIRTSVTGVESTTVATSPPPSIRASKTLTPSPVTLAAGSAYGDGYGKAKDAIKKVVDKLTPAQVEFMSGLGFTDKHDLAKKRTDIVNSVLSSWDASAAKYMKAQLGAGDAARLQLRDRLAQFDVAYDTQGKTAVPPDK